MMVTNISDQDMCFCGRHVSLIENSAESHFECQHCRRKYHTECMKRPPEAKTCCYCHLQRMIPHRPVIRVLFVGLLRKNRKKQEISLPLSEEEMSIQYNIQVRCFRLKEDCQNFIQFPDSCCFSLRSIILKDFEPLERLSSLKYRKDEPFYISQGLHYSGNRIMISQKFPGKDTRDDRIEPETHVVGIYLIQEQKIDWILRHLRTEEVNSFEESK